MVQEARESVGILIKIGLISDTGGWK